MGVEKLEFHSHRSNTARFNPVPTIPPGRSLRLLTPAAPRSSGRDSCRDPHKYDWLAPDQRITLTWRSLAVATAWILLAAGYVAVIAWMVRP